MTSSISCSLDTSFSISSEDIQNWLMLLNIVLLCFVTVWLHFNGQKRASEQEIMTKLENIQKISIKYPYLEEKKYTSSWSEYKKQYINNELTEEDKEKFLRYNAYTELIFNLTEISLSFYKTESNLLNKIDFKSWLRVHKCCWRDPLDEYSNKDIYSVFTNNIIDSWTK